MKLEDFVLAHGLTLDVQWHERLGYFYVRIKDAEVMERGFLRGPVGAGITRGQAMMEYSREISRRRLAIRAMSPDRREIDVPLLHGADYMHPDSRTPRLEADVSRALDELGDHVRKLQALYDVAKRHCEAGGCQAHELLELATAVQVVQGIVLGLRTI